MNYCPSTFSLVHLPPPLPKVKVQYILYRQCVAGGWGGGLLSCVGDHILQEVITYHSVSGQIQDVQNCYTTPNKNRGG
jgi:hypothetical protein